MAEYRIVLVDSDASWRKNFKAMLVKLGYWVIGDTSDGLTALKMVRARQPDLVIVDAALSGIDGYEIARIVYEDKLAPVIMTTSSPSLVLVEKAREARIASLLVKPVDEATLLPLIELTMTNYQEIVRLENQVKELKEALETRKLVEKAKGILMQKLGLSEPEAFKRMQRQSMNKRISMRQVAEAIIMTYSLQGD
ncbi:MAG: ANTAR domain-containing response regulator [Bacillota bacterium]|uniref:ANTAR domain-containing response regulator n=1 Tax=Desulfurispora thermophila TaxID=265470 RepID=UPI00037134A8|nr:ANTAR domain-containing protein [Desulfurispora thermophila]